MEYDNDKVDEMALALLFLTHFKEGEHCQYKAWKGLDWNVLNRLHDKDYIYDPKNKNKSIILTEVGFNLSKKLFQKHFGIEEQK